MMLDNDSSTTVALLARDKARPLTLKEVLRLRDGLEIPQGSVPGYPVQIVRPRFNRREPTVLCTN